MDEIVWEILLRLPPDEPEHLFRAALVCKPWLRILCDPAFRRRYRVFHGAPPLLGLLHRRQVMQGDPPARFASTTSMPDFPHPSLDGRRTRPLDCRHGRTLIHMFQDDGMDLLVWDPVTGDRHTVPEPDIDWLIYSAAVFCATDGCDHLDCHSGPFGVVFVATDDHDELVKANAYSSETRVWTTPVRLDESYEPYAQYRQGQLVGGRFHQDIAYVLPKRGAVIGDEICFTLRWGHAIVKYNLRSNCLSMINPPAHREVGFTLMVMDDCSLGFAVIKDSSLYLWSTKVNSGEAAEWIQRRVIKLETIIPIINPHNWPSVVGSAEGVDVIFISSDAGLFTIDLKSGRVRKVEEPDVYYSVLPYMSFYTPDRGALLSLAKAMSKQ